MAPALLRLTELQPGTLEYAQTLRNALDEMSISDAGYLEQMQEWSRGRSAHLDAVPAAERSDHAAILTPRLLLPVHVRGLEIEVLTAVFAALSVLVVAMALGWTLDGLMVGLVVGAAAGYGLQVLRDRTRVQRLSRRGLPRGAHEVWGEA